jgi:hypothetical protein
VRETRDLLAAFVAAALMLTAMVTALLVPTAAALAAPATGASGSGDRAVWRSLDVTDTRPARSGDEVARGGTVDPHGVRVADAEAAAPPGAPPLAQPRRTGAVAAVCAAPPRPCPPLPTGRAPPGPADR